MVERRLHPIAFALIAVLLAGARPAASAENTRCAVVDLLTSLHETWGVTLGDDPVAAGIARRDIAETLSRDPNFGVLRGAIKSAGPPAPSVATALEAMTAAAGLGVSRVAQHAARDRLADDLRASGCLPIAPIAALAQSHAATAGAKVDDPPPAADATKPAITRQARIEPAFLLKPTPGRHGAAPRDAGDTLAAEEALADRSDGGAGTPDTTASQDLALRPGDRVDMPFGAAFGALLATSTSARPTILVVAALALATLACFRRRLFRHQQVRAFPRHPFAAKVTLLPMERGADPIVVRAYDISRGGLKVARDPRLARSQFLRIDLGGVPVIGRVVWTTRVAAGIEFGNFLTDSRLAEIRGAAASAAPSDPPGGYKNGAPGGADPSLTVDARRLRWLP